MSHPLAGQPFGSALDLCLILVVLVWVVSLITGDSCVWLDRMWSLCPPVYCLLVAVSGDFDVVRVNLMTALVVLWGVGLTYNFARKGGFRKGGVDYRWGVVREKLGPRRFQLLNIALVAPSQLLVVWLFTSPVHQAWVWRDQPLGWLDGFAVLLSLACFGGEFIGDQQMWTFQQDKKRRIAAGEEVAQPFIVTGLFRYSRHPSYLCEIGMWFAFCLFAMSASGDWFHWIGLGVVLLAAQFIGVIRLTEQISAQKYPTYGEYQARTPTLVPLPGLRRKGPSSLALPQPTHLEQSNIVPSLGWLGSLWVQPDAAPAPAIRRFGFLRDVGCPERCIPGCRNVGLSAKSKKCPNTTSIKRSPNEAYTSRA